MRKNRPANGSASPEECSSFSKSMHCKGVIVTEMTQLTSREIAMTVKRVPQYSPTSSVDAKIG